MLKVKSKKIIFSILCSVFVTVLSTHIAQAESYESGGIAAKRAAEQRAAIAKRAEMRKKEAEEKKAAEAKQSTPTEIQPPQAGQNENTPVVP